MKVLIVNTRMRITTSKSLFFMILIFIVIYCQACSQEDENDAYVILKTAIPPDEILNSKPNRCIPDRIVKPRLDRAAEVPSIYVPRSVTNLAKGKIVTASDSAPIIGSLELVTDGNKIACEGSYVEFPPGTPQWVEVDLVSNATIYAVWVWRDYRGWKNGWESCYEDVIIDVCNLTNSLKSRLTIFNNDYDNSAGRGEGKDPPYIETNKGRLIPVIPPIKGRYVRLYSKGNCGRTQENRYVEVEVFGVYGESRVD